ncbi:MAG TPA: HWE histidine kinase domain-containing protein [Acetobacteraceae bacterium]|nr:HWE histidine kinase domain-containing protein [Acetobacteraceae bacterium]
MLPFALLTLLSLHETYQALRANIEAGLASEARVLAALVENELDTHIAAAQVIASSPAVRDGRTEDFAELLRGARRPLTGTSGAWLDREGTVIAADGADGALAASVPDLHARTRATGRPAVSDLVSRGPPGEFAVVVVARARPDAPSESTIAVVVRPERLLSLLEGPFPTATAIAVLDRQQRFIARRPGQAERVGQPAAEDWRAALARAPAGIFHGRTVEGARTVQGYATTPHGWIVGIAYSSDVIEAPLRALGWRLAATTALALIAAMVFVGWLGRRLRSAASRLLEAAAALRANRMPPATATGVREYDEVAETLGAAALALRQRAEAVAASEARWREVSDAMPQLVWTADAEGRLDHYNRQRAAYYGGESHPLDWRAIVHPDDLAPTTAAWTAAMEAGQPYEMEHRLRMADGRWHWHISRALPQRDAAGRVVRWIGTATDVDAHKRREDQTHFLLREVNHRSKNLLAVAQAMTRQTAMDESPDAIAETLCGRFAALAASQDLMLRGEWRRVALEELVRVQLSHFVQLIGGRVRLEGPPVRINATAAQAIGMALHELATNAAKYGALAAEGGHVGVSWRVGPGPDGDERFVMEWVECGGPPVTPPVREGFGQFVMVRMVEQSLGGEVALEFRREGLYWRLDAPAVATLEEPLPEPALSNAAQ